MGETKRGMTRSVDADVNTNAIDQFLLMDAATVVLPLFCFLLAQSNPVDLCNNFGQGRRFLLCGFRRVELACPSLFRLEEVGAEVG